MKEYKAYEGKKFTIEWYYSEKGVSQPLDFFEGLPAIEQQKLFHIVKNKIIITNAFNKKAQKLRKQDKVRAIIARADYIKRVKEGVYYEDEEK